MGYHHEKENLHERQMLCSGYCFCLLLARKWVFFGIKEGTADIAETSTKGPSVLMILREST